VTGTLIAPVIPSSAAARTADAIIALRCKEASSQREAICNHRHNQTGAA
jgi:hypothetical protein